MELHLDVRMDSAWVSLAYREPECDNGGTAINNVILELDFQLERLSTEDWLIQPASLG